MKFVFVSYAPEDQELATAIVDRLKRALEPRGVDVRTDPEMTPRRILPEWVDDHIVAAERVLVLWSKSAKADAFVQAEAEKARSLAKYVACLIDPELNPKTDLGLPFNTFHTPLVVTPAVGGETTSLVVDETEIAALAEELSKPPSVPSPEVVEIGAATTPAESANREETLSNVDPWTLPGAASEGSGPPRLRTLYVDSLARLATHGDAAVREAVAKYFGPNLDSQDDALARLAEAANRINSPALWDDIGAVNLPRRRSDAIEAWRKAGLRDEDIYARLGLPKPATPAEDIEAAAADAAPEPPPAPVPPEPKPATALVAAPPPPARVANDDEDEDGRAAKRRTGGAAWFVAGAAASLVVIAGGAASAVYLSAPLRERLLADRAAPPPPEPPCLDPAAFNTASLSDQRIALMECGLMLSEAPPPAWCSDPAAFNRLMTASSNPDEALRACGLPVVRPPAGCSDPTRFDRLYRDGDYPGALNACGLDVVSAAEAEAPAICPDPAVFNTLSRTTQLEQLRACGLALAEETPRPVATEVASSAVAVTAACSETQGPPCRVTLDGATTLNELAQAHYQTRAAWCWIYESNPQVFDSPERPPQVRNDPNCVYRGDSFDLTPLPTGWTYELDCEHRELLSRSCPRDVDVGRAPPASVSASGGEP